MKKKPADNKKISGKGSGKSAHTLDTPAGVLQFEEINDNAVINGATHTALLGVAKRSTGKHLLLPKFPSRPTGKRDMIPGFIPEQSFASSRFIAFIAPWGISNDSIIFYSTSAQYASYENGWVFILREDAHKIPDHVFFRSEIQFHLHLRFGIVERPRTNTDVLALHQYYIVRVRFGYIFKHINIPEHDQSIIMSVSYFNESYITADINIVSLQDNFVDIVIPKLHAQFFLAQDVNIYFQSKYFPADADLEHYEVEIQSVELFLNSSPIAPVFNPLSGI